MATKPAAPTSTAPRLKRLYNEELVANLQKELGLGNVHQVPRLEKIVINMGVGESTADSKKASVAAADLALIAGQNQVVSINRGARDGMERDGEGLRQGRGMQRRTGGQHMTLRLLHHEPLAEGALGVTEQHIKVAGVRRSGQRSRERLQWKKVASPSAWSARSRSLFSACATWPITTAVAALAMPGML